MNAAIVLVILSVRRANRNVESADYECEGLSDFITNQRFQNGTLRNLPSMEHLCRADVTCGAAAHEPQCAAFDFVQKPRIQRTPMIVDSQSNMASPSPIHPR